MPISKGQAGADPYSVPLDRIDVSDAELFETDTLWGYFARLRKEDPVHHCAASDFGPYWSVTRYHDIVHVEKNPEIFSSARSIVLGDPDPEFPARGRLHHDGRRPARRPPQGGPAGRLPAQPDVARAADPHARLRDPRRPPGRRDLRLGRPRLDRAHDGHARDALRLPLRGAPQAHLLVGHGDGEPAPGGLAAMPREDERQAALMECLAEFTRALEATRKPAADRAPRLHHGARQRRRDARHGAAGVPRHADPADRRRQRHDAELDHRRRRRAEREPGASTRSCATTRR